MIRGRRLQEPSERHLRRDVVRLVVAEDVQGHGLRRIPFEVALVQWFGVFRSPAQRLSP